MNSLSEDAMEDATTPLDVPAGTLILLHGRLPHSSPENTSDKSRYAYALHLIDGGAQYDAKNWLQRNQEMPLKGFI